MSHEHRYGLPQIPSAFSVIGRHANYPSVNSHHHDFTSSLTHDPLMATSPRIQRSPTSGTSASWWRQSPISSRPQTMNSSDIFGNQLMWLSHEQEHMRPHESVTYHNPAPTYRNFDFLNGPPASSYYSPSPRFFPEPTHTLHALPAMGKERPLTWDDRLGGSHSLMMDISGNGYSPWQDIHQQRFADRQQKQIQESVDKERSAMVMTNNHSTSFSDSTSVKCMKPSKYSDNHSSNDSRLKVSVIPPSDTCLNVPVISNETRHDTAVLSNSSRVNLLGLSNDSHLKVPGIPNVQPMKIPSLPGESAFNIPSLANDPKFNIPSITNDTQLSGASISNDAHSIATSTSTNIHHGINYIPEDNRIEMTESRLTTPPMLSKEQQNVSSSMSTHSKMIKPVINSHPFVSQQDNTPHLHVSQTVSMSSQNVPLLISEAQHPHMPRNSLQNISHGRSQQKIPQKQQYEKPCTTQPDINAFQNIDRIDCDVKKGPSSTSSSVKSRRKSSSATHAATNPENHNKDMSQKDLQKQDVSMINNPVSPLSSSSSHFSPTMLHKSTVESKMAEEPLSSNLKQQTKSTGCKPPLIERFRAPAAVSGEKGTSSDDDTTDGDDGDSGTDTDSVDDTISEDGNDENKEVSVKVKKQPDQPGMQSLQKQVQQVVQQVFFTVQKACSFSTISVFPFSQKNFSVM